MEGKMMDTKTNDKTPNSGGQVEAVVMPYKPCQFDRSEYLDSSKLFEAVGIEDAVSELCEFNSDAEDLAFELAYTRYALAKAEREIDINDKLLAERERVLNEIPACPVHGNSCIPHALEWIEKTKAALEA
jgi:hypothetical protein